jgi:hypothetical protein
MIVFYQRQYTVAWSILSLTDDFVDSMAQDRNFDIFALGDRIAR